MNSEIPPELNNVKDQIGFCGIWCGSCIVGNGTLRELTRRYQETTEAYGLKGWAPADFDYEEFSKGLASIQRLPICPGCRKGGGRDNCEIRNCTSAKSLQDCTECDERSECKHTEILEKMRSGALDAGLSVKSGPAEGQDLIEAWMAELESKWPCCILFLSHR
jgi:hypothetical protein